MSVVLTAEFLEFSNSRGNDLSTPLPQFGFPGLRPSDRWCLCAPRWREALKAGCAPRVVFGLLMKTTSILFARRSQEFRPGPRLIRPSRLSARIPIEAREGMNLAAGHRAKRRGVHGHLQTTGVHQACRASRRNLIETHDERRTRKEID